jgi:hypothetical protein
MVKAPWMPGKGWITDLMQKLPENIRTKVRSPYIT